MRAELQATDDNQRMQRKREAETTPEQRNDKPTTPIAELQKPRTKASNETQQRTNAPPQGPTCMRMTTNATEHPATIKSQIRLTITMGY